MLRCIENIGIASMYGINYFGQGVLTEESHISFISNHVLGQDLLYNVLNYVPTLRNNNITDYGGVKNRQE